MSVFLGQGHTASPCAIHVEPETIFFADRGQVGDRVICTIHCRTGGCNHHEWFQTLEMKKIWLLYNNYLKRERHSLRIQTEDDYVTSKIQCLNHTDAVNAQNFVDISKNLQRDATTAALKSINKSSDVIQVCHFVCCIYLCTSSDDFVLEFVAQHAAVCVRPYETDIVGSDTKSGRSFLDRVVALKNDQ